MWIERVQRKKTAKRAKSDSENSKFVDIKPFVRNVGLPRRVNGSLEFEMMLGEGKTGKVRSEEVIRFILDEVVEDTEKEAALSAIKIHKTNSFIEDQGQLFSPMEIIQFRIQA